MSEEKFIFKEGDIVTCAFFGDMEFELKSCTLITNNELVRIKVSECQSYIFLNDGRYYHDTTHSVLKLVRRPKKKVKKWVSLYNTKDIDEDSGEYLARAVIYDTSEEADLASNKTSSNFIGIFEIDVDEDKE